MCMLHVFAKKKTQKLKKDVSVFRAFSTSLMGYRQGCYRINIFSNMLDRKKREHLYTRKFMHKFVLY